MVRKVWLVFTQALAIGLAGVLIVSWFAPDLARVSPSVVTVMQADTARDVQATAQASYSGAARKALPSVVNIYTSKALPARRRPPDEQALRRFYGGQFDDEQERANSLGSGVIVSTDGYVLTNNHVVEGADEIAVLLAGGRSVAARVVGTDPDTDLAILKLEANNLQATTFGNSDRIQVGDVVLAIGNPFGVGQTVTMGIVSATGRNRLGINTFENFIQTDAAINPGNSGGALVDAGGNLIGINTAIFSPSGGSLGIGFAIPVSLAKQVMEQIIKTGRVERGWIGVGLQEITPEIASSLNLAMNQGALVSGVVPGGPAARAGMKAGDVLKAINGKQIITDVNQAITETTALRPGEAVLIDVMRQGKDLRLSIEVGRRPPTRLPNR